MKPPSRPVRTSLSLMLLLAFCVLSIATDPVEPPPPPPPAPEEEDTEPCGDAEAERVIRVFQEEELSEGTRVAITQGGGFQGGGEEGIDLFIHVEGVRSDASTVEDLSVVLRYGDEDTLLVSHEDAAGGFGCFGGVFRTRVINMNLPIGSFEIDGEDGFVQVELTVDEESLAHSAEVRY